MFSFLKYGIQAPAYLAELAQETEAGHQQRRQEIIWKSPFSQKQTHDVLDGDAQVDVISAVTNALAPGSMDKVVTNFSVDKNLPPNTELINAEDVVEVIEQMELDEVTESEIDSPVREEQNKAVKIKERKAITNGNTPQYSQSRQTKNKKKQPQEPKKRKELTSIPGTSIFDFSSDDDADMAPTFNVKDDPGALEIEDTENETITASTILPSQSLNNKEFIPTRTTRTRSSSRQKSKIDSITSSTAPAKKGGRRKVNRL